MVLDAGMKKSTEGRNIPKWHKNAREYCTAYDADLKVDFDKRKARREEFAEENGP